MKLAQLLVMKSNVVALPEDDKRIVFLLAEYKNATLELINLKFSKEFGPAFKIFESYNYGGKEMSWEIFVKRAAEIKQGYKNHCFLSVQDIVDEALVYYKNYKQKDTNQIKAMVILAEEILAEIGKNLLESPIARPEICNKIELFFKSTGRLELDIDKIKEEHSFENLAKFITITRLVGEVQLYLISKKTSISNISAAENYLLNYYAKKVFDNFVSLEELKREHKYLELIDKKVVN